MRKIIILCLVVLLVFSGCSVSVNGEETDIGFSIDHKLEGSPYDFESYEDYIEVAKTIDHNYTTLEKAVSTDKEIVKAIDASTIFEHVNVIYEEREDVLIQYYAIVSKDLDLKDTEFILIEGKKTKFSVEWENAEGEITAALEVRVPIGYEHNISVNSISGSITSQSVSGDDVNLNTISGLINVEGLVASTCSIDSISGEVTLTDITSEDLNINTISGDVIVLEHHEGELNFNSISGDIQLDHVGKGGDMSFETISGDAYLKGISNHHVLIDTMSGDIDVDSKAKNVKMEKDQYDGKIGDGDYDLNISTLSGDIEVN